MLFGVKQAGTTREHQATCQVLELPTHPKLESDQNKNPNKQVANTIYMVILPPNFT
jgi:hypothetical protein